jgi:large subunit ribosomal protein L23
MNPYNVLIKPITSEKSERARKKFKQYSFAVQSKATKEDVKKAIEVVFGVKVVGVNTSVVRGKVVQRGARLSKRSNWKKAVVSLTAESNIDLFQVK